MNKSILRKKEINFILWKKIMIPLTSKIVQCAIINFSDYKKKFRKLFGDNPSKSESDEEQ